MTHEHQKGLNYRMPYGFGPASGPRQGPDGKDFKSDIGARRVSIATSFLTQASHLEALLPPRFELAGEPVVTVELSVLSELAWLAGRGYSILYVRFPVRYKGTRDVVTGSFLPVLWENKPDPVLTGREELGFSKLFCDLPPPRIFRDSAVVTASWEGHQFLEMSVDDLTEVDPVVPPFPGLGKQKSEGILHYKYLPETEDWGQAAVEHACLSPAGGSMQVQRVLRGKGQVSFLPTSWEQMPTQFHVVSALAALPQLETRGSWMAEMRGGGDLSDQRKLV